MYSKPNPELKSADSKNHPEPIIEAPISIAPLFRDSLAAKDSISERMTHESSITQNDSHEFYMQVEAQFGISTVTAAATNYAAKVALRNLFSSEEVSEEVLSKFEDIIALYFALCDCKTSSQFFGIMFLYLKTHYHTSVALKISEVVQQLLADESVSPQSGDDEPKKSMKVDEEPKWLGLLRSLQDNWMLAVHNPLFEKVSILLSMGVALGITDPVDISLGKMKIFTVEACKEQVSATSLIDAVLSTVVFFAEGGYQCFQEGSIKPFLFSSGAAAKFDAEYMEILQLFNYAQAGNLKDHDMDNHDFDKKMAHCIQAGERMYRSMRPGIEKKVIFDRINNLKYKQAEFVQARMAGGLRIAPYAYCVSGGTSVGKSSFVDILMTGVLKSNGFDASNESIITLKEGDRYMSNMRSFVTGVKFDDWGNTKPEFWEKAVSQTLIEIVNNVKTYANMAEVELKAKVALEPRCVGISTNDMAMAAQVSSIEGGSVTRRCKHHFRIRPKPEFRMADSSQLDEEKVDAYYTCEDGSVAYPPIQDIWEIDVYRVVVGPQPEPDTIKHYTHVPADWEFRMCEDEEGRMKSCDIWRVLRYAFTESEKHFAKQKHLIEGLGNLNEKMVFCEHCNRPTQMCHCLPTIPEETTLEQEPVEQETNHEEEPVEEDEMSEYTVNTVETETTEELSDDEVDAQFGEIIADTLNIYSQKKLGEYDTWKNKLETRFEDWAVPKLLEALEKLEESKWTAWTTYVPHDWIDFPVIKKMIYDEHKREIQKNVHSMYTLFYLIAGVALLYGLLTGSTLLSCLSIFSMPFSMTAHAGAIEWQKAIITRRIAEDRASTPELFKRVRDKHMKYAIGAFAAVAGIYTIKRVWSCLKFTQQQGSLQPETAEDIAQRDSEVNPWKKAAVAPIPMNPYGMKNVDQLSRAVCKNLLYMKYETEKSFKFSGALIIKSNVVLMPHHMLPEKDTIITFRHTNTGNARAFKAHVDPKFCIKVEGHDLALCYVPTTGSAKDLIVHFPEEEYLQPMAVKFLYRDEAGEILEDQFQFKVQNVQNGVQSFRGSYYNMTNPTFRGLCMGTMVTHTKTPFIVGFHLGGKTGHTLGVGSYTKKGQIEAALKKLHEFPGHLNTANAGTLVTSQYGVNYFEKPEIHFKSPLNFLEGEDYNYEAYGSVKGRVTPSTEVAPSIISPIVKKVTGVENQWAGPKFRGPDGNSPWHPWRTSLLSSLNPSIGFPQEDLDWAIRDFMTPVRELIASKRSLYAKEIKPLTRIQTVSGIDGKRFIDAMNMSSSVGYPLSGPKSDVVVDLDPEEYPEFNCPRDIDQKFWDEYDARLQIALRNERFYEVFKACLKDEPTKVSKDKVRVFQAASMTLQLFVRRYFLPIARFMSLNPFVFECGVGVNAHSPEMHDLLEHVREYGEERGYAGDYSKYDLRMPCQLMLASFHVFIEIAALFPENYSEDDLQVMRVVATEICNPLMAYNGDLIQHKGTNPSGQNLTVFGNDVSNSLIHRCAFYNHFKATRLLVPFQKAIRLITYGDDYTGSVKESHKSYNNRVFQAYCAANDMKVTPPTKDAEMPEFMHCDDIDFLKRKPRIHEVGFRLAPLAEESIFKSLHSNLKSKTESQEAVSASVISGAMTEWFFHGREVYDRRHEQMKEVVDEAGLSGMVSNFDLTFDDRVEKWNAKYIEGEELITPPAFDEADFNNIEAQSGEQDLNEAIEGLEDLNLPTPEMSTESQIPWQVHVPSTFADSLDDISLEDICQLEVISALDGEWKLRGWEYVYKVGKRILGVGDLHFTHVETPSIELVVETKSVSGKRGHTLRNAKKEVKRQAKKYAKVIATLQPTHTVFGVYYTEHEFKEVYRHEGTNFPPATSILWEC